MVKRTGTGLSAGHSGLTAPAGPFPLKQTGAQSDLFRLLVENAQGHAILLLNQAPSL